ncbi:MAG TPA: hypothetical protein VIP29_02370 [Nitrososphaeraceae archaeon]
MKNYLSGYKVGDPANRLQRTVETLKIEKSRLDRIEAKIQRLERKHGRIR